MSVSAVIESIGGRLLGSNDGSADPAAGVASPDAGTSARIRDSAASSEKRDDLLASVASIFRRDQRERGVSGLLIGDPS
jgi:hypothetical protein